MFILIKYLLVCFIVPELLGVIVCGVTKNWERPFFCYISGFVTMLAMAYVLYLPIGFTGRSFHRYVQICGIAFAVWSLVGLIVFHKPYAKMLKASVTGCVSYIKKHPMILAFIGLLVFQLVRLVLYTQIHYSDDDSYITIVGDIMHSDIFYRTDMTTGRPLSGLTIMNPKFRFTGWLAFHALLSELVGVHPLILVKTLLPVAIILLHYMVVIDLYRSLGRGDGEGLPYFLFIYVLLMEFAWGTVYTSWSYYFLTWVWYGKSFLQFVVLPLILTQFLRMRWKNAWDWIWVVDILVAGVGASTMALILLPAEGAALFGTLLILHIIKKVRARHVG